MQGSGTARKRHESPLYLTRLLINKPFQSKVSFRAGKTQQERGTPEPGLGPLLYPFLLLCLSLPYTTLSFLLLIPPLCRAFMTPSTESWHCANKAHCWQTFQCLCNILMRLTTGGSFFFFFFLPHCFDRSVFFSIPCPHFLGWVKNAYKQKGVLGFVCMNVCYGFCTWRCIIFPYFSIEKTVSSCLIYSRLYPLLLLAPREEEQFNQHRWSASASHL